MCRLRWSHIDLDRGEVLVGGKITSLPGELRDEEWTKNRSKRRVAIGAAVVALLRARRLEQAKEALAGGVSLSPDAYVFSHEADGSRPIRPDSVTHRFTALARRLEVEVSTGAASSSASPCPSAPRTRTFSVIRRSSATVPRSLRTTLGHGIEGCSTLSFASTH